jgi:hypothetical protein
MSGANSPGLPTTPEARNFLTQLFSGGISGPPIFEASLAVIARSATQTSPRSRKLLTNLAANSSSGDGIFANRLISAAKCRSMK